MAAALTSTSEPTERAFSPHTRQPKQFSLAASGRAWGVHCIWLLTAACPVFAGLWLKFRVITGTLQLMLMAFLPGLQESHQLCQAVTAALQLSKGQLCADCPEQDTES